MGKQKLSCIFKMKTKIKPEETGKVDIISHLNLSRLGEFFMSNKWDTAFLLRDGKQTITVILVAQLDTKQRTMIQIPFTKCSYNMR